MFGESVKGVSLEGGVSMSQLLYEAPGASWMTTTSATVSLFFFFGSVLLSPLLIALLLWATALNAPLMLSLALVMLASLWIARQPWRNFADNAMFAAWRSYFRLRIFRECPTPEKKALYAVFPHGVFPIGLLLSSGCVQHSFPEHSPNAHRRALIASVFFYIPVLSTLLTWLGCIPASSSNVLATLKRGSCYLLPEGIAGVFLTSRQKEQVYLKNRRGFVRLAMQAGASLVPVYVFGHSHLLDVLPGAGSSLEALSRRLRVSLMFFFGKYYFPIPRAIPLTVVMGTPISLDKVENPSEEQVNAAHAAFCAALVSLFDKHKDAVGWADKTLDIV